MMMMMMMMMMTMMMMMMMMLLVHQERMKGEGVNPPYRSYSHLMFTLFLDMTPSSSPADNVNYHARCVDVCFRRICVTPFELPP